MKRSTGTSTDTKPDVDKAKKVYRAALDAIRRLDEISKQKKAYREVFLQDAVGLRNKLKEYCERLMFYNPSEYGRKAEEVLWRKVFYDIIQVVKHNRKAFHRCPSCSGQLPPEDTHELCLKCLCKALHNFASCEICQAFSSKSERRRAKLVDYYPTIIAEGGDLETCPPLLEKQKQGGGSSYAEESETDLVPSQTSSDTNPHSDVPPDVKKIFQEFTKFQTTMDANLAKSVAVLRSEMAESRLGPAVPRGENAYKSPKEDVYSIDLKPQQHVRPYGSLETAYRSHLASATGYYQHLMFKLQQEFSLNLFGILDFHPVSDPRPSRRHSSIASLGKKTSQHVMDWAQRAVHRCLICLGDIARYQQDFDHGVSAATAERYYYQALMLYTDIGMPHNQLGTLAGSRYYSCEAAYHYIRCMSTDKPFEGAQGNLKRLFEKNHKRYIELGHSQQQQHSLTPGQQQPQNIRQFFVRFLYLLDVLYDAEKRRDTALIQSVCQATLHDFNLCMFYEPSSLAEDCYEVDSSAEDPEYLEDGIVYKIVVMCLCTIYLLQRKGSPQVTAAIAFLLALFSHILNHVTNRLQGALYEKEHPNKLLESHKSIAALPHDDNHYSSTSDTELDETPSQYVDPRTHNRDRSNTQPQEEAARPKKHKQSRLRNLRRRRRRHHSDSSETSDLSEDSDLSEGGDPQEEEVLSEDSDDDLATYFDNDSDSESDSLMESQELKTGFAQSGHQPKPRSGLDSSFNTLHDIGTWSDLTANQNLATLSSELFSSSMTFLGQDLNLNMKISKQYQEDIAVYENCKDVIQGRKDVPVPPGFTSSLEARHVADITNKLLNFQIETDTEVSACPTDTDPSGVTETEIEADDDNSCDSYNDKAEAERLHMKRVMEVIQMEGLLSTVKVMCDWMKCHTNIINTCAQSSQSLWCRLSVLLNFLPQEKELITDDEIWPDELKMILRDSNIAHWKQLFPLREDANLCGFPPFVDVHASIDFSGMHRGQLSEIQETFLRIVCLRHFGHFLSNTESVEFSYSEDQAMFFGPTETENDISDKAAQEKMRDAESRRNQLMRDMAQLRLQAEVSQLEGSVQENDQPVFPPYLIPETSTLCSSLPLIKQLIVSARGIMVIPLSVIDSLDFMKKESSGAREAIRWLENEFRKGNRYIRAQKSNETLPGNNQRMLKKRNRDQWCLNEMLSCAHYLAQQSGNFSSRSVVAILTDHSLDTDHQITANLKEGVTLENITDFASRWKEIIKSKG